MKQLQIPQLETPDMVDEQFPWHARANILIESYGFQPTTREEINTAFSGVIAFDEMPALTGTHLQEVLLHQRGNPTVESPDKAVRAIVRGMGHFFLDAATRRDGLRSVYDTLQADVNPNLALLEVENLNPLGILSGIQHHVVRKGVQTKRPASLKGGIKDTEGGRRLVTGYDTETNDEIMIELLMRTLPEDMQTAGGFSALTLDAGKSHKSRREFWRAGLIKSRSHLVARPVVDEILGSYQATNS